MLLPHYLRIVLLVGVVIDLVADGIGLVGERSRDSLDAAENCEFCDAYGLTKTLLDRGRNVLDGGDDNGVSHDITFRWVVIITLVICAKKG